MRGLSLARGRSSDDLGLLHGEPTKLCPIIEWVWNENFVRSRHEIVAFIDCSVDRKTETMGAAAQVLWWHWWVQVRSTTTASLSLLEDHWRVGPS